MEVKELENLLTQYKEEHLRLLKENNRLLHIIIEQNNIIFEIGQKHIQYYSDSLLWSWFWQESPSVRKLRKDLEKLLEKIHH